MQVVLADSHSESHQFAVCCHGCVPLLIVPSVTFSNRIGYCLLGFSTAWERTRSLPWVFRSYTRPRRQDSRISQSARYFPSNRTKDQRTSSDDEQHEREDEKRKQKKISTATKADESGPSCYWCCCCCSCYCSFPGSAKVVP